MIPALRPHQQTDLDRYADRHWFIYRLFDPRDGLTRYIGWTVNLNNRLKGHICDAKRRENTRKSRWINKLMRDGVKPGIAVVQRGFGPGWQLAEQFWISAYSRFSDLTNATAGGEGQLGVSASDETRRKMGLAQLGKKRSEESRRRMSAAQLGLKKPKPSQIMNDRMSEIHPFRNQTHCKNGHPYDERNTYVTIRGKNGREKRACRKCRSQRQRDYMRRKAAL